MGQLEDILKHQNMVRNNIMKSFGAETSEDSLEKSFEDEVNPFEMEAYKSELTKAELDEFEKAKHQDGDMHPNGKWVWRASANGGKGDWRVAKPGGAKKTDDTPKNVNNKKLSELSDDEFKKMYDNAKSMYQQILMNKNISADKRKPAEEAMKKLEDEKERRGKSNKPASVKNTNRSIFGDNGYMSQDFLSYLEKNKEKIWPGVDFSEYTDIKVGHRGSKDSNYVAISGQNKNGSRVTIDDAYITGEGTNVGVNQVRKNPVIKELTEKYKNGITSDDTSKQTKQSSGDAKKAPKKTVGDKKLLSQNDKTSIRNVVKKMFGNNLKSLSFTTKDELIVEVEGKVYGDSYAVWKEWKLKDGEPTEGGYSGDTSKSRIDDLMKKLGKENLKKLKRISLKESYD